MGLDSEVSSVGSDNEISGVWLDSEVSSVGSDNEISGVGLHQ